MTTKRIVRYSVGIVLALFIVWWRVHDRADDSAAIHREALKIVATMDGYQQNKAVVDPMTIIAHETSVRNRLSQHRAGGRGDVQRGHLSR